MGDKNVGRRDFFKIAGSAVGISALAYYFGLKDRPTVTSSDDLPDYIDDGIGLPVFRSPYLQKDVSMAAFLYSADVQVLTNLCDQTLNAVSSPLYHYVPLMSNIMLVYADMLVSSLDERDAQIGSIPETEVGFWMLTVAMQVTSAGEIPHHLAWFIPGLFVDESNAIASGREVYGFRKQAAVFSKPEDVQSPHVTADVLGFKQFSSTAIAQNERLFELSASSTDHTQSPWQNIDSARTYFIGEITRNVRPDLGSSILSFVAQALTKHIPLVFLKQIRSASNPRKADIQKVVEAPLQIREFFAGSVFSQSYTLSIMDLASHPLIKQLGLKSEQSTSLGAWLKVDFILGLGSDL